MSEPPAEAAGGGWVGRENGKLFRTGGDTFCRPITLSAGRPQNLRSITVRAKGCTPAAAMPRAISARKAGLWSMARANL